MPMMNLEEVQSHLQDVIAGLDPGEPLVITKDGEPVATLIRSERKQWPCKAGSAKDKILWISPDFDAPLEEFREYME